MRVGITAHFQFSIFSGGGASSVLAIAETFKAMGHSVTLINIKEGCGVGCLVPRCYVTNKWCNIWDINRLSKTVPIDSPFEIRQECVHGINYGGDV